MVTFMAGVGIRYGVKLQINIELQQKVKKLMFSTFGFLFFVLVTLIFTFSESFKGYKPQP